MEICQRWRFGEYITAIATHPSGNGFAIATAGGEVVVIGANHHAETWVQTSGSIDCLAFSSDGKFLAAAGQDGMVWICRDRDSIETLNYAGNWIDKLVWHPKRSQLAVGVGKTVQIWEADRIVTLPLKSSVLDLAWSRRGDRLALGGNGTVQIWQTGIWTHPIVTLQLPAASTAIAWSPEDAYFAVGNFDRTVWVVPGDAIDTCEPWQMRGFPTKVATLRWSAAIDQNLRTLKLATVSAEGVVIWSRSEDDGIGWELETTLVHADRVTAIAWHPVSQLLATAARDRNLRFWQPGSELQTLECSDLDLNAWSVGSSIAWQLQDRQIMIGSEQGDLFVVKYPEWGSISLQRN